MKVDTPATKDENSIDLVVQSNQWWAVLIYTKTKRNQYWTPQKGQVGKMIYILKAGEFFSFLAWGVPRERVDVACFW